LFSGVCAERWAHCPAMPQNTFIDNYKSPIPSPTIPKNQTNLFIHLEQISFKSSSIPPSYKANMTETTTPLSKVDSLTGGPESKGKTGHRRASSSAADVFSMADLQAKDVEIKIAPETQTLNWKLNTSPSTIDDKDALKKFLCSPKVKKVDLHFPLGLEVTARNLKGVTIKDALDAIHKQFKKKADDELDAPYLAGFEWDKEECYTRFVVHQKTVASAPMGKKGKKKGAAAEE